MRGIPSPARDKLAIPRILSRSFFLRSVVLSDTLSLPKFLSRMSVPTRSLALVLLAALLFLHTGCLAYRTVRPAVSGQVVSSKNGAPVAGADVLFMTKDIDYVKDGQSLIFTDASGHFAFPARKAWRVSPILFPIDYFPQQSITARKKGFLPQQVIIQGTAPQSDLLIRLPWLKDMP